MCHGAREYRRNLVLTQMGYYVLVFRLNLSDYGTARQVFFRSNPFRLFRFLEIKEKYIKWLRGAGYEANVSAQQDQAEENPWLFKTDVLQSGQKYPQATSGQREKASVRIDAARKTF